MVHVFFFLFLGVVCLLCIRGFKKDEDLMRSKRKHTEELKSSQIEKLAKSKSDMSCYCFFDDRTESFEKPVESYSDEDEFFVKMKIIYATQGFDEAVSFYVEMGRGDTDQARDYVTLLIDTMIKKDRKFRVVQKAA